MKATEILKTEHAAITLLLDILEKACETMESGGTVADDDITRMIDFLETFADGCHHRKEEEILFPALEKAGIPREHGPIGVMLAEHDHGRHFVAAMHDDHTRMKAGDGSASRDFVQDARAYRRLLLLHIQKENEVLFPLADRCLETGADAAIVELFDRVEREEVGAGKHEAYHAMLKSLSTAYLH